MVTCNPQFNAMISKTTEDRVINGYKWILDDDSFCQVTQIVQSAEQTERHGKHRMHERRLMP